MRPKFGPDVFRRWSYISDTALVPKFGQGTERRSESPTLCTFYNADFIIYSSMGSFYLPCVAMLLLYWKIFRVINDRIRRSRLHDAPVSSSGTHTVTAGQQPPTWRHRITGRRTFVRAVFDRLLLI